MQTFLPYADFEKSAQVLDRQRLGKQRVEVLQLLKALAGETKAWVNHPCTKMWKSSEQELINYGIKICNEWISRGYKDTCLEKISRYKEVFISNKKPAWLGNENFHKAHQSNLMRKKPEHYSQFNWNVPNDLPYIW